MTPNQATYVKMPSGTKPCRFLKYREVWGESFALILLDKKRVLVKTRLLCDAPPVVQRQFVGLVEGGE
jgi:hypothetical protein